MQTKSSALEKLVQKRTGGVFNIRGISFQVNYTIWRLLSEFQEDNGNMKLFQLEGVEDLDFYELRGEHIQIKCLNHSLDAYGFVEKILQNLVEVFEQAAESRFTIVSNQHISGGKLGDLKDASKRNRPLSQKAYEFWAAKIHLFSPRMDDSKIRQLLSQIRFEHRKEEKVLEEIQKILIGHYGVIQGNELQFIHSLFHHIHEWSREKKVVSQTDVLQILQEVRDDIAKGSQNKAIREGWIQPVSFEPIKNVAAESAYFEGKAARPWHIAANLPVIRAKWEMEIIGTLQDFDVTVLKASSGQGKSTLAWRVAQQMQEQGYTVFELHEIGEGGIQDLILFLESRLKVGKRPLVVLDGLNEQLRSWAELATRAQSLPLVKFLLTTREEDWFRYGGHSSRLFLKPINIDLNEDEARRIFEAFRKRGLVHASIPHWQVAWEKVKNEKLLIEFVYLLTQGQMLQERLEEQIRTMRNEPDTAAKKAILRLTASADVLNLRIPTVKMLELIRQEIGFQADQDDLLQSLKHEYHIQIEGASFVVGLHPVRSKHLLDVLHATLPLSQTFVSLFALLEEKSLFAFTAQAPLLLIEKSEKDLFLQALAGKAATMRYADIVEIIYGIFATDAHYHWQANQDVFDRLINNGLEIYSILSTPFSGLEKEKFEVIQNINPDFEDNLNSIVIPDMEQSNVANFMRHLVKSLKNHPLQPDLKGLSHLERWAERFGLSFELITLLTTQHLREAMEQMLPVALGELLYGVFLLNESLYRDFYQHHSEALIAKLHIETDTLTIQPQSNDTLEVRYLVDQQTDINSQSVTRIENIAYCLPIFQTYDTAGINFLTPPLQLLIQQNDSSVKRASWDNWLNYDSFRTRGNQVWIRQVEQYYEFSTFFEWQEYWMNFREMMLEWLRQSSRVLESTMAGKNKLQNDLDSWNSISLEIWALKERERKIAYNKKTFQESRFKPVIKKIEEWNSHARNILLQFIKFTDDETRRVMRLNASSLWHKLSAMQEAFEEIAAHTGNYFETENLQKQEIRAYEYFARLTDFVHEVFMPNHKHVPNVRAAVKDRQTQKLEAIFNELGEVKGIFEALTTYELFLPHNLIEEEYYNSVVLGIRGLSASDLEREFLYVLLALQRLREVDAHSFYLVLIEGNNAQTNNTIRFSKELLDTLQDAIEDKEVELKNPPLPLPLTPELLNCLEGIKMPENISEDPQKIAILALHESLWRYSETRKRTKDILHIHDWCAQMFQNIEEKINQYLSDLQPWSTLHTKYQTIANQVLSGHEFDEKQCQQYYYEDISAGVQAAAM